MPRNAGAQMKLWSVIAAVAALASACGDQRSIKDDAGVSQPKDAGQDAMVEDSGADGSTDSGDPTDEPDGSPIDNLNDQYCVLRIAAQCDGPEDCESGACCAGFEPTEVSFTAMECAPPGAKCDFQRTFPLCHDGQFCSANADLTCRTSVLVPGDFIGICLPESGFLPSRPPTGEALSGLIDCGAQQCVVGQEHCCMREGFDVRRLRPMKFEPYCAPIGEPCDCSDVDTSPRDGGMLGDEDAGR
jgi:hypothetical protein